MAYYTKNEIRKYISDNNEYLLSNNLKPLTPIEQCQMELDNEEDVVGFFWVNVIREENNGVKIKLDGKAFVKIDFNLYTDDRFAIDAYQAQADGVSVSDVIKNRIIEQERASKSIESVKEDLENGFIEKQIK